MLIDQKEFDHWLNDLKSNDCATLLKTVRKAKYFRSEQAFKALWELWNDPERFHLLDNPEDWDMHPVKIALVHMGDIAVPTLIDNLYADDHLFHILVMIGDLRAIEPLLEYAAQGYEQRIQAALGYITPRTVEQQEFVDKITEGLKKE